MRSRENQGDLVSPLEAAHHLGITSELLFQYTKKNFAKASGLRSLRTVQEEGKTKFSISELDEFNSLIAGPWPTNERSRSKIPEMVVSHLRTESFNQCSRCPNGFGVETAHIVPWAKCRSHHHDNLIRICTSCHSEHDDHNSLPTEELLSLKRALIAKTRTNLSARMATARPLKTVPRPSASFVGRERELSLLIDALHSGRSVLITGVGGIGKTELLVQALGKLETGRPTFWIDVEKHRSSADIVAALRVALQEDGIACPEGGISARLDALQACVVFDGIEHANFDDIDDFEDALSELYSTTSTAQIVATSQVVLHKLTNEARLKVGKLDEESSKSALEHYSSSSDSNRQDNLNPLVEFCGGHALTLRLAGALMMHYGGAAATLRVLNAKGSAAVMLPGRKQQSSATSLELCLQTAYDTLSAEARQIFWALSESPAGIPTNHFTTSWCGISDPIESLAELRRWHLVGLVPLTKDVSRTHVLGPIRSFAVQRACRDNPGSYEAVLDRLVHHHGMVVAVLELEYADPEDAPYVLKRYGDELPNFLHTLALARAHSNNSQMLRTAVSIVASLMPYFFVRHLPEQGARAMHDAAELALSAGHLDSAGSLILQLVGLAQRAEEPDRATLMKTGMALADQLERRASNHKTLAQIAMCRGIAAHKAGDYASTRHYAHEAIRGYRSRLRADIAARSQNPKSDEAELHDLDDLHNDISHAFGLLGDALLSIGSYQDSAKAYRYSLRHQRGSSVALNQGQSLHQIGNCESHLGQFRKAAASYLQAAVAFDFIGMEEYLSNALGELGYALLDARKDVPIKGLDPELIERGLLDLTRAVSRVFGPSRPLDHIQCVGIIRKLFGTIALVSLVGYGHQLSKFCATLGNEVVAVLLEQLLNGSRDEQEGFPLMMIDLALRLGFLVSQVDQLFEENPDILREIIGEILRTVCNADDWAKNHMRLADWLGLLFTHRWRFNGGSPERVREFIKNFDDDVVDYLDLTRDDSK